MNDEMAIQVLKAVLSAHDTEYQLWEKESVEYSQSQYKRLMGGVPSIESAREQIGVERADQYIQEIIEWRKFIQALKGKEDPCHYCGTKNDLIYLEFGLMRVESSSRAWGETAATTAISALTLPLLGVGKVALPGKNDTGELLKLNLVICRSCASENSNMFGIFMLKEKHVIKHPYWQDLHDAGFTKFIEKDKFAHDSLWFTRL